MGRPPKAAAPLGRRRRRRLCFLDMFLIILYHRYLWIFLIYSLYIPYIFPKYVPYISLVCFLIYGVNRRQVLIAKPHFYLFPDCTPFIFLIHSFMTFIKIDDILCIIVPFGGCVVSEENKFRLQNDHNRKQHETVT